jgi:hypothetical protein
MLSKILLTAYSTGARTLARHLVMEVLSSSVSNVLYNSLLLAGTPHLASAASCCPSSSERWRSTRAASASASAVRCSAAETASRAAASLQNALLGQLSRVFGPQHVHRCSFTTTLRNWCQAPENVMQRCRYIAKVTDQCPARVPCHPVAGHTYHNGKVHAEPHFHRTNKWYLALS